MSAAALQHAPVLPHEAIDALCTRVDGIYVDGTFGRGGHARRLLERLGPRGRLVALDRDPDAVAAAHADPALRGDARFSIHHTTFAQMRALLASLGIAHVDGVLLDLGVSSPQLDDPARGFSFRADGPLDMRMDPTRGESAAAFLARADARELAGVIRDYGEERFAVQVARALVARRDARGPVASTRELAEVVAGAVRTREPGLDPATRTFQALRIFVNAELDELERGLEAALEALAPGGRLVVISFHSLEDRRVKAFIVRESRATFDRRAPFAEPPAPRLRAMARVRASVDEVRANPRARSAVMRVAERTSAAIAPRAGAADGRRP
jgi:16S rRNA (cytosine1402-N4)-methyltransferase